MKSVFRRIIKIASLFIVLGIWGCVNTTKDAGKILIGSTLDLTGPNAVYGEQVKQGMNLAVEEINAKGGIKNNKLEVVFLDSKSDAKLAVNNTQQLISVNGCKVIIGEISSSATEAMIPVVEQNKAFLFAPASSSPKLAGRSKFFARNWPSDVAEATSAAIYARNDFAATNAAIIYVNSEYGTGLKDKFTQKFETDGGKIIASEPYSQDAKDFKTLLLKIKAKNPDCIYLAGNPKEMGACIKQIRESGIKANVVSNTGFLQKDCLSLAAEASEGVIVPSPNYDPTDSSKTKMFLFFKSFKAKYGTEPTMVNANAYDALFLISDAIQNIPPVGEQIAGAVRNRKNFEGAAGNVSFTEGEVEFPIVYYIIKSGKQEILKK